VDTAGRLAVDDEQPAILKPCFKGCADTDRCGNILSKMYQVPIKFVGICWKMDAIDVLILYV
jgi:signal recognition particle GTPase